MSDESGRVATDVAEGDKPQVGAPMAVMFLVPDRERREAIWSLMAKRNIYTVGDLFITLLDEEIKRATSV